jgi:hypothetical protein
MHRKFLSSFRGERSARADEPPATPCLRPVGLRQNVSANYSYWTGRTLNSNLEHAVLATGTFPRTQEPSLRRMQFDQISGSESGRLYGASARGSATLSPPCGWMIDYPLYCMSMSLSKGVRSRKYSLIGRSS